MADQNKGKALLEGAYALKSPEDNIAYYRDFSQIYDSDFVQTLGYAAPDYLAQVFYKNQRKDDTPIADIGCGTGLVAKALKCRKEEIDGIDISQEMLDVSQSKSLYNRLYRIDLTQGVEPLPKDYGAVVSVGSFTHGHLGPDNLVSLLDIARPGALFCIMVNEVVFKDKEYGPLLDALQQNKKILDLNIVKAPVYDKPGHAHSNDEGIILSFRKFPAT